MKEEIFGLAVVLANKGHGDTYKNCVGRGWGQNHGVFFALA